jgi:hypothetical protein
MAVRKNRTYITKAEFEALDYFLRVAQIEFDQTDDESNMARVQEIERLRAKLKQMQLQQKKV